MRKAGIGFRAHDPEKWEPVFRIMRKQKDKSAMA
jgi:hypothetical protein